MNRTRHPLSLSWLLALLLVLSGCATVDTAPSDVPTADTTPSIDATPTLIPEMEDEETASIITDTIELTDTQNVTDTTELTDTAAMTEPVPTGSTETVTDTAVAATAPLTDATTSMTSPVTATVGTQMGLRNATGALMRASALIGYPVENLEGNNLGEIDNLIINLSSGEILFANLSYGGFLDLGDKTFPIPLSAFRWDPEFGTMLLDVPEETLETAPGFDETWPDLTAADWDVEADAFWQDAGVSTRGAMAGAMANAAIIRASELLGLDVQNTASEDVGDVQDLIVNLEGGTVPYVVMGFGGFLGLGEDLFAVPLSELNATVTAADIYGVAIAVDVSEEQLQDAPRLTDDWPDTTDPNWDGAIREFWGLGAVDGVPAADTVVSATSRDETTNETGDATGTTDEAGIEGIVTTALGPGAAAVFVSELLTQTVYDFDGNALGQISDAVVNIGSGDIAYLIVAPTTDTGDANAEERIPLPVGVLSRNVEDQRLTLNADADILAGAPRLATAAVEDAVVNNVGYLDAVTEQAIYDYWAATGAPVVGIYPSTLGSTADTVSGLPPLALQVSNMVGRTIFNRDQEEVGILEDAIYEANAIRYGVLALNEQAGRTVVPLYALLYDIQNQRFVLDVGIDALTAAPGFTEQAELDLQSVNWSTGINEYWDTQVGLIGQLGVRLLASTTLLAENMLGDDVLSADLEDLGDIEDLIIDGSSGQIRYVVLSFGGFLGIGEDYFAIPLDQLIIDPYGGGFSTALNAEVLEGAPSFTANAWPDLTTPDWDADFRTFWADEVDVTVAEAEEPTGAMRVSDLLGLGVVDANGNNLGNVDNLLIDFFQSQVTHYVLGIGGFLNIGEKEIAVPWNRPTLAPVENVLLLDVTEEIVDNAPEFDTAVWPTVSNTQWLTDADAYWTE